MARRAPQRAGLITRRDFFNVLLNTVMGVIALIVAVPAVGAALTPAFQTAPPLWVKLGSAAALKSSSVSAGSGGVGGVVQAPYTYEQVDHWAKLPAADYAYLRYIGGSCPFFILSPICTHMGCHVQWIEADNQFHCPCHGSVYTIDGLNVSGPAPLPLGVFQWKLVGSDVWIAKLDTFTTAYQRTTESPAQPCLEQK